jgi:hypothetical protein
MPLVGGGYAEQFGWGASRGSGPFACPVHSCHVVRGILGSTFAYIETLGGCFLLNEATGEFQVGVCDITSGIIKGD